MYIAGPIRNRREISADSFDRGLDSSGCGSKPAIDRDSNCDRQGTDRIWRLESPKIIISSPHTCGKTGR